MAETWAMIPMLYVQINAQGTSLYIKLIGEIPLKTPVHFTVLDLFL